MANKQAKCFSVSVPRDVSFLQAFRVLSLGSVATLRCRGNNPNIINILNYRNAVTFLLLLIIIKNKSEYQKFRVYIQVGVVRRRAWRALTCHVPVGVAKQL